MDFRAHEHRLDLCGTWHFTMEPAENGVLADVRAVEDIRRSGLDVHEAQVPGNIELDLHRCGAIPEPFYGMNIAGLTWLERQRVVYFRKVAAEPVPGRLPELVFEGIDCYGTVVWNGRVLGRAANMLIEHRFPLDAEDVRPENELMVILEPPLQPLRAEEHPTLLQAMAANYESLRTRKAPHMYGWDIMPRALSAGLWRPVYIRFLPAERFDDAYLQTVRIAPDRSTATLSFRYCAALQGHPHDGYEVEVSGECGASSFHTRQRILGAVGVLRFDVAEPKLWWPRGRGDQNLYACRAQLVRNGEPLDEIRFTLGIRTIELERTDVTDEAGRGEFCFHVNGERFFVLGTNWVPLDAYHSRDADRVDRAMDLVRDIGCNMIRCWGGNVYESDRFYELCDRYGVLVWQDFAMACAIYPQDAEFQETIRSEAVRVVRRLRQHPCIALWAGDNECDYSFLWGDSGVDPNTNVLTRRVLPEVIRQEDPRRPYLPSSPYISPAAMEKGTKYLPEDHLWGPRDYHKSPYYRGSLCHFASEIGYHGCPSVESLREFLSPERLWPRTDNPEWLLHATSPIPGVDLFDYRVELMAKQVRVLFGEVPETLEEFAYASQCSQAEAKKFFIEMFRSQKWRRTGIIWWNLLDGWPQFSDAVVDYYFRPKRAYSVIRRCQKPLIMVLREPVDDYQELVVCNDTRTTPRLRFRVSDLDTGAMLVEGEEIAGADVVTVVAEVPCEPERRRLLLIEWEGDGFSGWNHYLAGPPPFDLGWYRRHMETLDERT